MQLIGGGNIGRVECNWQNEWYNGEPVWTRSDDRFYYIKDHLGSIRVTIDQTNQVTAAQDYSAYGEIWRSLNSSTPGDRYKFTEKELDIETGYAYHGARYYDPWRITWNSPDPLEDVYAGYWSYNYCFGNPNILKDPSGMGPEALMNVGMRVNQRHRYMKDINGASTKAIAKSIAHLSKDDVPEEFYDFLEDFNILLGTTNDIEDIVKWLEKSPTFGSLVEFISQNPKVMHLLNKFNKFAGPMNLGISSFLLGRNISLSIEGKRDWFDTGWDIGQFGTVLTISFAINPGAGAVVGICLSAVKWGIDNYPLAKKISRNVGFQIYNDVYYYYRNKAIYGY